MQMHEVGNLIEVGAPHEAEKLISEGWTLVAIVSGERYENGSKNIGPIYVLGQRPEAKLTDWKEMQ